MHFESRSVRQLPSVTNDVGLTSPTECDSACDKCCHNESDYSRSNCNALRSPPECLWWNSLTGRRCTARSHVGLQRIVEIFRRLPPVRRMLLETSHDDLSEA